jgi:hypothetical protein
VTSDNQAVVRRFIEAFNERDLDGFVATLDPHIEIQSRRGLMEGIEEARAWATRAPGGVQQTVVVDELRQRGDQVVALVRRQWHWDGTGELATEDVMAMLFTLRDTLVVRWQPFARRPDALDAAGIGDPPE